MVTQAIVLVVALLPGGEQTELLKTFRDEFVAISPGKGNFPATFAMGCADSNQPPNEVKLEHSFAIAKYEVPQNLWHAVMQSNPSRWKGKRNSVEMLSFDEAKQFCQKATQLMRAAKLIAHDEVIRLPTETEWEYAARAGTSTRYSFGDDVNMLDDYAWSNSNAAGNDPAVGAKKPNPWGLYDVHGYLWEWCETDKTSTAMNKRKTAVLRGGSWKDKADKLTSCTRIVAATNSRDDAIGLRCVLAKVKPTK